MLIAPGNLSAWHADSVLIFLAQDLSQYHWRSMHDCAHVHHVQLHCYLVPLRIYIYSKMTIQHGGNQSMFDCFDHARCETTTYAKFLIRLDPVCGIADRSWSLEDLKFQVFVDEGPEQIDDETGTFFSSFGRTPMSLWS